MSAPRFTLCGRRDVCTEMAAGDQLLIDGRLVEIEDTSGSLTFEGIENEESILVDRQTGLSIRALSDSLDVFYRIRFSLKLRANDVIRIGLVRFEVHRFNHSSASVQGIRPSMEDEDFCRDGVNGERISMFSVYDGHGGMEASKFLRSNFHKYFSHHLFSSTAGRGDINTSLFESFKQSDQELLEHIKERGLSMGVGAVVNTVVIDEEGNFFCANLGDSRAVIGLNGGRVVELSRDLKPGVPEEADRIRRCGGFVSSGTRVNGRLAVSRAIGDFEYKTSTVGLDHMVSAIPEIRIHKRTGQERFLIIACDGLYDVMTSRDVATFIEDRIGSFVMKNIEPDPSQICIDIITECVIKRGTTDNVTIILIFLRSFI